MNMDLRSYRFKIFGSTTINSRGQVVIPASARREMGFEDGDTLLAVRAPHGSGLMLFKVETIEQVMSQMGEKLTGFAKMVQDYKSQNSTGGEDK